jgi:hypothetical protein
MFALVIDCHPMDYQNGIAHCLGPDSVNSPFVDPQNRTYLSVTPILLSFMAKYRDEGEYLGIPGRHFMVGQTANNGPCFGEDIYGRSDANGLKGKGRRSWIGFEPHFLVLAGNDRDLSGLDLLWFICTLDREHRTLTPQSIWPQREN